MELYEKIRIARAKKGLTQEKLAELLNVNRATISQWETGGHTPAQENIIALEKILGVSLREAEGENNSGHCVGADSVVFVPVVSGLLCGSCGNGNGYEGVEWEFEKNPYPVASLDLIGYSWQGCKPMIITAEGDSMSPFIQDGDKVLFVEGCPVNVGDVAVVSINNTIFIKGIAEFNKNEIELQSFNSFYYPNKKFLLDEGKDIKVLGKVLEVVSSRKVPKIL